MRHGTGLLFIKFIKIQLFDWFIFVEIGVGILGGTSSILLFLANVYLESYSLVMYSEIILIGVLVGLEIPLLTRIIEENAGNLRITLSSIFSFDYIGGLAGSIAFPLLLLPQLGYFSTGVFGGSNEFGNFSVYFVFLPKIHRRTALWKIIIYISGAG